jgi:hypothetical protein
MKSFSRICVFLTAIRAESILHNICNLNRFCLFLKDPYHHKAILNNRSY